MQTDIKGVVEFTSPVHSDIRGFFTEVFRLSGIKIYDDNLKLKQVNHSQVE